MLRHGRPLKRWRWVGVFCPEAMLCAGEVRVGPARQTFWAVWDRAGARLRERTRLVAHGHVQMLDGRLRVRDGDVSIDVGFQEDGGVETICAHGGEYVWTRKQAGLAAHGTLAFAGEPAHVLEGHAVVDDTAGYHARVTSWCWAAGVGLGADGALLAFNLVAGVNDPPVGSERTVWVAGSPREAPPVTFAADLSAVSGADGAQLRFVAEAERRRRERLLLVRSDYRQPFGTFSGTLPGGVELAAGMGVMERHSARW